MSIDFEALMGRYAPDKQLKPEEGLLDVTAESVELAKEFLEKVKPIIETRNKLRKSSDDFAALLSQVISKLDELVALKNINAVQEQEVLVLLKEELLRG